jgi:small subunit ribosomal protein S6
MFIFNPNHYARNPSAAAKEIDEVITAAGGEMLVSRLWDDRRLAYPIQGHRKAAYWITYFRIDSGELTGLERQFRIKDLVMRHLFLKVDPRIVDALVSHASSENSPTEPAADGKEKAREKVAVAAGGGDDSDDKSNDDSDDSED